MVGLCRVFGTPRHEESHRRIHDPWQGYHVWKVIQTKDQHQEQYGGRAGGGG